MFLPFVLMYAALTGATVESPAAGALIMQSVPAAETTPHTEVANTVTGPLSTLPPPAETTPPAPQTALRVPFGGAVTETLARRLANHAGYTLAIEHLARTLSRKPGVRLFAEDLPRLMALGAPIHTLEIVTFPAVISNDGTEPLLSGELRVTVLWTQHRAEDDFLRECIADSISLESRSMAYAQLRRITADCLRLIRDAAILRRENGDDDPQAERLAVLLEQLDDLRLFLDEPFPPEAAKLERLLARNPGNPAFLLEFAERLLRMNQPSKALEALKTLNGGVPLSGHALYLRGLAQLALRLPTLAIQDFTAALRLNPDEPGYWQGSAMGHAALEDIESMCVDLEVACSLGLCQPLEAARQNNFCR